MKGLQNVPTVFLLQYPCFVEILLKTIPPALAACMQTLQLFEIIGSLLRVWQFGKSRLLLHAWPSPRVVLSTWFKGRAARGMKGIPGTGRNAATQRGRGVCSGEGIKVLVSSEESCQFPAGNVPGGRWLQPSSSHQHVSPGSCPLPAPGKLKYHPRLQKERRLMQK